jgi:hypothetical protein
VTETHLILTHTFFKQNITKQYLDASYDAMGALLAVRTNIQHSLLLQQRRVPALEKYINSMNMLLWPRFQSIMDLHIDSIKKAVTSKLMPSKDSRPHYVRLGFICVTFTA